MYQSCKEFAVSLSRLKKISNIMMGPRVQYNQVKDETIKSQSKCITVLLSAQQSSLQKNSATLDELNQVSPHFFGVKIMGKHDLSNVLTSNATSSREV